MSTTRTVLEYLFSPVAESVDQRLRQARQKASETYDYLSSFVITPPAERTQQLRTQYQQAIEPIKHRHEQRKALMTMRDMSDNAAHAELKDMVSGLIHKVDAAISTMTKSWFVYFNSKQITEKYREKEILQSLLSTLSFAEMSLCAEISLQELPLTAPASETRQFLELVARSGSERDLFGNEDFIRQFSCREVFLSHH